MIVKQQRLKWLLLCCSILSSSILYAQEEAITHVLEENLSGAQLHYVAQKSITLKPGFGYVAQPGKRLKTQIKTNEILESFGGSLSSPAPNDPVYNSAIVGSTGGAFNVSPSGAATYEIPIVVSPGTAEMEPAVSIVYNSQGQDGIIGKGFSLSGLSIITRGNATTYHNNLADPVDFDANDQLLLDGERLILKSGTYGAVNSEYRTENNRYAKIKVMAQEGGSDYPTKIKVWEKNGLIKEYGFTNDSRLGAKAGNVLIGYHSWLLNKVEDRMGNYLTVTYEKSDHEFYPKWINYTGNTNAGLTPYASVEFVYESRMDGPSSYVYGHKQEIRKLLKSIKTRYGSSLLRDYRLDYTFYDEAPHLTSVTEYNAAGEHYNPVTFEWNHQAGNFTTSSGTIEQGEGFESLEYQTYAGDYTGNGKAELLVMYSHTSKWELYKQEEGALLLINTGFLDLSRNHHIGDFNGDGLADYLSVDKEESAGMKAYTVYLANGNGFSSGWSGHFFDFWALQTGDFDGDGSSDILTLHLSTVRQTNVLTPGIYYSNTNEFIPDTFQFAGHNPFRGWFVNQNIGIEFLIQDFNADGKMDIYSGMGIAQYSGNIVLTPDQQPNNSRTMLYGTEDRGFFEIKENGSWPDFTDPGIAQKTVFGDFNGDGKIDLLVREDKQAFSEDQVVGTCTPCADDSSPICGGCPAGSTCDGNGFCIQQVNQTYWDIYYGTGDGFDQEKVNAAVGRSNGYLARVADVNGDGRSDLLFYPESGSGNAEVHILNGNAFYPVFTFPVSETSHITVGDFTGNGISDLLDFKAERTYLRREECGEEYDPDTENFDPVECPYYSYHQDYTIHSDYQIAPKMVNAIINSYQSRMFFQYHPLTNDEVYTKHGDATGDLLDVQFPMHVVSAVYADNGLGGLGEVHYQYAGAKAHRKGRGFLGFKKIWSKNLTQGTTTEQVFSCNNPHWVPQLRQVRTTRNGTGNLLSWNQIDYRDINDGLAKTYVYAKDQEVLKSYDPMDGSLLSTVTTSYDTYDRYGNTERITQTHQTGHVTLTENTYETPNVSNWIVGRLKTAKVTRTLPTGASQDRTSTFAYFSNGLLMRETIQPGHALALTTIYGYDLFGNVTLSEVTGRTHPNQQTTETRQERMVFDAAGRFPIEVYNALNHKLTSTFDPVYGHVLTDIDANLLTTTYTYDSFGRSRSVIRPDGNVTTSTYHWADTEAPNHGRYYMKTVASGAPESQTYYDRLGRALRSTTIGFGGDEIWADTQYDAKGQTFRSSLPYFKGETPLWTINEYDAIGRVIRTTHPDGSQNATVFTGLTTSTTNVNGQTQISQFNVLEQLLVSTDAMGNSMTYTYDPMGNMLTATDPLGNVTTVQHDILGNKNSLDDPDLGMSSYVYNTFGELMKQTDAKGNTSVFTYDLLGRAISRSISQGNTTETTTWTYDTAFKGAVSTVTMSHGISKSYTYDSYGRITSVSEMIDGAPYQSNYSYDSYGNLDVYTYPSGFQVKHLYTPEGYLQRVQSPDGYTVYWENDGQNARGQQLTSTLGNGLVTTRSYNDRTRHLTDITTKLNQQVLQHEAYGFDPLGNLKSRSNLLADSGNGLTETFKYDALNRLTSTQITGKSYGALTMQYDVLGNLSYKSDVGTYHYNGPKPHAVSSVDNTGGSIPATFQEITYTGFNKVSEIEEGSYTLAFTYGVDHERKVTKNYVDDVLTLTKVFTSLYEKESTSAGTKELHYIMACDGAVAIHTIEGGVGSTHYLLRDHLGSISGITDESGSVLERYSYGAWGVRRNADTWDDLSGNVQISYDRGFTGHEHLGIFSLINMNGRVYDPVLGRFLSPDPFNQFPTFTQSFNRYSYVLNNPLSLTDPSGYISIGNVFSAITTIAVAAAFTNPFGIAALAVSTFVGTFTGAMIDGANLGEAFKSAIFSTAFAVAGASVSGVIGNVTSHIKSSIVRAGYQHGMHGITRGAFTALQGGNFWHGFSSGAISSISSSAFSNVNFKKGLLIASISGGASSAIAGESFADGAKSGAFVYLFNHAAHEGKEKIYANKLRKQLTDHKVSMLHGSDQEIINQIVKALEVSRIAGDSFQYHDYFTDLDQGDIAWEHGIFGGADRVVRGFITKEDFTAEVKIEMSFYRTALSWPISNKPDFGPFQTDTGKDGLWTRFEFGRVVKNGNISQWHVVGMSVRSSDHSKAFDNWLYDN